MSIERQETPLESGSDGGASAMEHVRFKQIHAQFDMWYQEHFGACPHPEPAMETQIRRMCRAAWTAGLIELLSVVRNDITFTQAVEAQPAEPEEK